MGARRWIIVIGVMAATLLQVLDATIVNVALPVIQGNLGANFDEGAWIVTGYIIAAVIVIPLTPWLQQVFGRKQYYIAAIAGFTDDVGALRHVDIARRTRLLPHSARVVRRRPDRDGTSDLCATRFPRARAREESSAGFAGRDRRTEHRTHVGRHSHRRVLVELDFLHQHRAGNFGRNRDRVDAAQPALSAEAARLRRHRPNSAGCRLGQPAVRAGRRRTQRLVQRFPHPRVRRYRGRRVNRCLRSGKSTERKIRSSICASSKIAPLQRVRLWR